MRDSMPSDQRRELAARGFTRRDFARMAALLTAGASLPFYNEAALAQDLKAIGSIPADAVRINSNENPMGPCKAAIEAILAVVPKGGRYQFNETYAFVDAMAQSEGLPADHVMPFAGSSDPLHRAVMAFTSPSRPLVTADPGYEAPERAAKFIGAKTIQVPLRKDFSHDPQGMTSADPKAGVIYICNPNNPTGTITRKEDVDYIIANKPEGCVVLLDEAYIHFSTTATPAIDHVLAGKDVIVLRTFSKLYGMAGLRAGAALGRPDLLDKLKGYTGLSVMPATGMAGATASLKDKGLVADRRKRVAEIREDLFAWMSKKGYGFIPSEANMVLVDGQRPGKQLTQDLLKYKVAVGRSWPSLPNHIRVTIGTRDEMAAFRSALERVMNA
jgi:histidinol-phosphate aminotransferase